MFKLLKRKRDKNVYGFGTHRLKGKECVAAVTKALKVGYNFIDTAEKYYNSVEIGEAIKKSKRKRETFQIVHKLTDVLEFSRTKDETFSKVRRYLQELDTNYIDVLLMHGPSPRYHKQPEIFKDGNIEVWKAMIDLKRLGLVKSIGVSNYNKEQIMYLIEATGIVPDYIEIEYNVINHAEVREFKEWLQNMKIQIIGYSPLGAGNIEALAQSEAYQEYLKQVPKSIEPYSPVHFALRFCIQQKVIPIPRSSKPSRIKQNYKILKQGYADGNNTV